MNFFQNTDHHLPLRVVKIIFFSIIVNSNDNFRNRRRRISPHLEINYISKHFHIKQLPHIAIFFNFWQVRSRNYIFELIIPFQNDNFRMLRIKRPITLVNKQSRIPMKIA